jgi:Uma2 family endonuclease
MSMATLTAPAEIDLAALFASPKLPDIAQQINDRLAEEARRRRAFYQDMTDDCKMEFIEGEVIMHSPAKAKHVRVKGNILSLMRTFVIHRQMGEVFDEKALCVFPRNDYEPDIVFFSPEKAETVGPDTMKFPVPDLAVEVLSESTERRDRGVKFQDYEAHGVCEYWIVDAEEEVLEQYVIKNGRFQLQLKSGSGEITSLVIRGFSLPIRAFFDAQMSLEVMKSLVKA